MTLDIFLRRYFVKKFIYPPSMPVLTRSIHSHLKDNYVALSNVDVNVLTLVNEIIESQQKSQNFLVSGPKLSGKSAIGHLLAMKYSPSAVINSSQLQNSHFSNTINTFLRKCVNVKISEERTVLCGEVYELRENKICLRTTDANSEFSVSQKIYDELLRLNVTQGDVIRINKTNGTVERLGKTFIRQNEVDLVGPDNEIVDLPTGEIIQKEEELITMTLYEMDCLSENAKKGIPYEMSESFCGGDMHSQRSTDAKIAEWLDEGIAIIEKGILVIENSENIRQEDMDIINAAPNDLFSPHVILIDNSNLENSIYNNTSRMFQIKTTSFGVDDQKLILDSVLKNIFDVTIPKTTSEEAYMLLNQHSIKFVINIIMYAIYHENHPNLQRLCHIFRNSQQYN